MDLINDSNPDPGLTSDTDPDLGKYSKDPNPGKIIWIRIQATYTDPDPPACYYKCQKKLKRY